MLSARLMSPFAKVTKAFIPSSVTVTLQNTETGICLLWPNIVSLPHSRNKGNLSFLSPSITVKKSH